MSAARRLTTPQDDALARALVDAIEAKRLLADLIAKYDNLAAVDLTTKGRAVTPRAARPPLSPYLDEMIGLAVFLGCLVIAGLWALGVVGH